MLPASLLHLRLGRFYSHPLGEGSLPASLERLIPLNSSLPLSAVVLPPSLRALHVSELREPLQPNALPFLAAVPLCRRLLPSLVADALPSSLIDLNM